MDGFDWFMSGMATGILFLGAVIYLLIRDNKIDDEYEKEHRKGE